jgi:cyclophilin family peptidyl-prolyl cis-trans isomerase
MKLKRKALLSILIIVVLATSSIVVWSQFLSTPTEIVRMETSMGTIEVQLDRQKAPITVDNFVKYVKAGFYDGTVFHRVKPGFVIQGGGYDTSDVEKTTNAPIKLESHNGLKNTVGTIAMARTNVADSATSQFFINLADNTDLDYVSASNPGYAVFGKVVSGMDVVNKIAEVSTGTRNIFLPAYNITYPFEDWPKQDVIISKAYVKP